MFKVNDKVIINHPTKYRKFARGIVTYVVPTSTSFTPMIEVEYVDFPHQKQLLNTFVVLKQYEGFEEVEIIDSSSIYFGQVGYINSNPLRVDPVDYSVDYSLSLYTTSGYSYTGSLYFCPDELLETKGVSPVAKSKTPKEKDCDCSSYDLLNFGHKCGRKNP